MPDDKACHEDNGWHIRQVVSFRPKRPFLEGHDRREEAEDEKRRKTAEQSEKSSISPSRAFAARTSAMGAESAS